LEFDRVVYAQGDAFYRGKTITIVVGYNPGDAHDLWARAYARTMGRYIPGNPNILVRNMPGGGTMIAANYVYGVAEPDGTTLGSIFPTLYFAQLTGRKEVRFDWAKFNWIGSPEHNGSVFYTRADSRYKTLDDMRKAAEPAKCSTTAVGTSSHYIPKLIEETRVTTIIVRPTLRIIDLDITLTAATKVTFGDEKDGLLGIRLAPALQEDKKVKDQVEVLDRAAGMVKPGGRIAYITCSVLPPENGAQVRAFVARHPAFSVEPPQQTATVLWDKAEDFAAAALESAEGWLMTPRRTGTDGFFVSVLKKA
jgi:hypothetical protein